MAAMFQVCKEVERKRAQRMGVVRPFFPPQVARWQVAPSVNYHQCLIPVFELYSARSLFTTRLHGVKRARQIRQVGKYEKNVVQPKCRLQAQQTNRQPCGRKVTGRLTSKNTTD